MHRKYQMKVAVVSAFCFNILAERKLRKHLELELIKKLRSPFN
ncbi:MAG: hypothetical protein O4804_02035 [Trichodesmium sp. St11_bin5]|nr:hypothetical protein [Trichodesmium sp. St11_bin5]